VFRPLFPSGGRCVSGTFFCVTVKAGKREEEEEEGFSVCRGTISRAAVA